MSEQLVSTRDIGAQTISYDEALLQGLAPDGGLYVPEEGYPKLTNSELRDLINAPYTTIFEKIVGKYIGEDAIPTEKISEISQQAFSEEKFPSAVFGRVAPVTKIQENFYIQELSLGPTAAFKDMALGPLALQMDYVLGQRDEYLTLLGATSGDTGPAAEAAVKGLARLSLAMLSPEEGMSPFQKAQMANLSGGNITNVSVQGNFDDCQYLVKLLKKDPDFKALGAVNSINWGRIVAQIPYYVAGYLQVVGDNIGKEVDFVVPSGNFGNMLAGYIARSMGLPIRRLIAATNENDVLHTLIQKGDYQAKDAKITSSPSMDISKASNFERLLYDLLGRDPERVRNYMDKFEETGRVKARKGFGLQSIGLHRNSLRELDIDSGTSNHAARLRGIRWVHDKRNMFIDPHTADAVNVGRMKFKPNEGVPMICLSTAAPVKFEDTVRSALGFVAPREKRFKNLEKRAEGGYTVIGKRVDELAIIMGIIVSKQQYRALRQSP